jgi:hypothetical protein
MVDIDDGEPMIAWRIENEDPVKALHCILKVCHRAALQQILKVRYRVSPPCPSLPFCSSCFRLPATMDMTACADVVPSWPSPTRMPFNGYNGSLHRVYFYVPSYHINPYTGEGYSTKISWNMIDAFVHRVTLWAMTLGVCLGMMLMTLLYILFITPKAKRWKPFHSSLLAAVLFKTISFVVVSLQSGSSNFGLQPAYPILTTDYEFQYTTNFIVWRLSGTGIDLLATISTLVCLFIQARTTLAGLRLSHRALYLNLLSYLLVASLAASTAHILSFAVQAQLTQHYPNGDGTFIDLATVSMADTALTAIVFGSYCLIAFLSITHILWTRRALLGWGRDRGGRNTRYDRALALLAFILLESLVGPLVLAIMIPVGNPAAGYVRPDILLLPVLLALLPFGGLFSANGGGHAHIQQQHGHRMQIQEVAAVAKPSQDIGIGLRHGNGVEAAHSERDREPGVVHLAELSADDLSHRRKQDSKAAAPSSAIDRELAALDEL